MEEYISTVSLECNGHALDDFKAFEEDTRTLRKAIKLMKKTGLLGVTPVYGFNLDYVVPKNRAEFDFDAVQDGTVVVDYENGSRTTFTGCSVLEVGSVKYDGENEAVKNIKFIAAGRVQE